MRLLRARRSRMRLLRARRSIRLVSIGALIWTVTAIAAAGDKADDRPDERSKIEKCNRKCDEVTVGSERADCFLRCNPEIRYAPVFSDDEAETTVESLKIDPPEPASD